MLNLLKTFVETSASDLVCLEAAIEEQNPDQAVASAHSIKGAAALLGLTEICEVAKKTELDARKNNLKGGFEAVRIMREKLDQIAKEVGNKDKPLGSLRT